MIEFDEANSHDANSTADAHPERYRGENGVECIDAIRAALGDDAFESFCVGQCIRYLFRYRKKNGVNDLHKCADYLRWATEIEESKG